MEKEFPKQLLVTRTEEDDSDSYYFTAHESDISIDDGSYVAVYQLVEVKVMKVTTTRELIDEET